MRRTGVKPPDPHPYPSPQGGGEKGGNARSHPHRRRLYAALAPDRFHARHHAGGDPRRRSRRRRVLRRVPAAEPFPRHFCRRRLQCRVHSGLCAHPHPRRRDRGKTVRRPHLHLAAGDADRAAGAGAHLHAAGDRPVGARLFPRAAAVRARGRPDADHVSLSAADHAGDAVGRHPQRAQSLRRGGGGVDPAQCVDDGDARGRLAVSECRPRCRLGRADFRRAASRPGRRRCLAGRRHDVVSRAHLGRRRAPLLQGAGAGNGRLGRHAAGAVRRHHHRELSHHRRAVGALLRRPHRSIADRRDRHCGGHRAGAGDDAPGRRPATTPAPARRKTAPSNSRCCWRCLASSPSWSFPAPSCAACSCAARSMPRMRTRPP